MTPQSLFNSVPPPVQTIVKHVMIWVVVLWLSTAFFMGIFGWLVGHSMQPYTPLAPLNCTTVTYYTNPGTDGLHVSRVYVLSCPTN